MKAKIKATGEIVEVEQVGHGVFRDNFENTHMWDMVDLQTESNLSEPSINWEQRRYELALAIYPDVLKHNSEIATRINGFIPASQAARSTMECVDVMIKLLKGGQE